MAVPFNQLAIYVLILILGWLLGLLSRSGGAWRRKYEAERDARLAAETTHAERDAAARARIAALERHAPPVVAATAAPVAPVAASGGTRDDLALIHGLSPADETGLTTAGILRYADLARVGDDQTAAIENRIGLATGTIARGEWREQAALLADGRSDEHRTRFA